MKKFLLSLLFGVLGTCNSLAYAHDYSMVSSHSEAIVRHIFSKQGAQDVVAAYGVMMLVTIIHELGHAVVAKLACGSPIDVVIGGPRRKGSRLKCAGVELAGLNPLESLTHWKEGLEAQGKTPSLAKQIGVGVAGPLAQAITGASLYALLKNTDRFFLAKIVALGGLVDTVAGVNGIYGALYLPWTDSAKIVENIKEYRKGTPSCITNK